MEKIWILYALGGLLCIGIIDFNKKIVLMRGYTPEVYLFTTSILFFTIFWLYSLFFGERNYDFELIWQSGIYGITTFLAPLGMITAYKYSSVGFSSVAIRLMASFLLLLIGVYLLGDTVNLFNIFGFLFGMVAIFLLSGWKKGDVGDIHMKGILGICIAIVATVFGHSFFKYIVADINVPDFTALQATSAFLSLLIYLRARNKFYLVDRTKIIKVFKYALVPGIIFPIIILYLVPNLYIYGPLSLGYKILSYSIIIPIALSIIFFGEPINRTRIFAFILTSLSIFLFLI